MEIWKNIPEYEGKYMVSSHGRVKSLKRQVRGRYGPRTVPEKMISLVSARNGYKAVCLYNKDQTRRFYVHRLVAQAFIPNPENKPQVNHMDLDKKNNRLANLEWATRHENCRHFVENTDFIVQYGGNHNKALPVRQYDVNGNWVADYSCIKIASKATGVYSKWISRSASEYPARFHGMLWQFIDRPAGLGLDHTVNLESKMEL